MNVLFLNFFRLLKAADQGHYEGAELLKTCFETNRGITESNCHKIRSFLEYVFILVPYKCVQHLHSPMLFQYVPA